MLDLVYVIIVVMVDVIGCVGGGISVKVYFVGCWWRGVLGDYVMCIWMFCFLIVLDDWSG